MPELALTRTQYLELEKLGLGAFAPLAGFMDQAQFQSVVETMRLPDGTPFPLPITLQVGDEQAAALRHASRIDFTHAGVRVGAMELTSVYQVPFAAASEKIYGVATTEHPGVRFFTTAGNWFLGGPVTFDARVRDALSEHEPTPQETRALFAERGWRTVAGFQTRNVPHRAHEYLLRLALEQADGLLVQPLIGKKKRGDYTPEAVIRGYERLLGDFFPADRVKFGLLTTSMRYAGPREAVFHALIRRNYGCTHFIVGRDHAGVGSYYDKYEAQRLALQFAGELGITILPFSGPFHCAICDAIVTERTCPHVVTAPDAVNQIAGTDMRRILTGGAAPEPHLMRPEVVEALRGVPLFIDEEDA